MFDQANLQSRLKSLGDAAFREENYELAISLYSEMLRTGSFSDHETAVVFSNRSLCYVCPTMISFS